MSAERPGRGGGAGDDRIGVGLVGFGAAGSVLHASLVEAEPRLALRAVATSGRDAVERRCPGVDVVPSAAELFARPDVELAVVSVPNAVHHELVGAALRAGKHVVVDKPFVPTTAEADELMAAAAAAGRHLAVFHNRRWDGDFLTVAQCVRSGLLGEVSTYVARYDRFRPHPGDGWQERPLPGSGTLYDLGSHLVDQALTLFGAPETVTADVRAQRPGALVDDYVHLVLGYGPLRVLLHAGSLVRAPGPRFEVHGDRGSFVKDGIDRQEASLRAGLRPGSPGWGVEDEGRHGTLTTEVGGLDVVARVATLPGAYEAFYRAMAAAIAGDGPVPVPAAEGRLVVSVLEHARRASDEGRTLAFR